MLCLDTHANEEFLVSIYLQLSSADDESGESEAMKHRRRGRKGKNQWRK
jgi:hypothetical protein